jgi:hypothetical protein
MTESNGALATSSTLCSKCNAPTSSDAPSESHRNFKGEPSESKISQPDTNSDKILTNSNHLRTAPDQSNTQMPSTTRDSDPLRYKKSRYIMKNERETKRPDPDVEDSLPTPEERAETRKQSLSRQGFVVEEDVHGLRLSGVASRPGGLSSQLSPYDVVRLAAELEGGIVPIDQRKRCPKCDAVVSPGDKRCQWCGENL